MTHSNWRDAISAIKHLTGSPSSSQRALAEFGGISLSDDLPSIIAGVRLQDALADALGVDCAGAPPECRPEVGT